MIIKVTDVKSSQFWIKLFHFHLEWAYGKEKLFSLKLGVILDWREVSSHHQIQLPSIKKHLITVLLAFHLLGGCLRSLVFDVVLYNGVYIVSGWQVKKLFEKKMMSKLWLNTCSDHSRLIVTVPNHCRPIIAWLTLQFKIFQEIEGSIISVFTICLTPFFCQFTHHGITHRVVLWKEYFSRIAFYSMPMSVLFSLILSLSLLVS